MWRYRRNILQWEENDIEFMKGPTGDYLNHFCYIFIEIIFFGLGMEGALSSVLETNEEARKCPHQRTSRSPLNLASNEYNLTEDKLVTTKKMLN